MGIQDIKNVYIRAFLYTALLGMLLVLPSLALSQSPVVLFIIWGSYSLFVIWQCLALWGIYKSRKHYPLAQREQDIDEILGMLRDKDGESKNLGIRHSEERDTNGNF